MNYSLLTIVSIALILSISLNAFLYWYQQRLLSKFLFISENLNDLVTVIDNYKNHLQKVYKMEMFYGDDVLRYLVEHTNSLLTILEDYEDVYSITMPLEREQPEGEEVEEKKNDSEEEPKKDVFYAGTRRGDN